jgi:outer membrane receptor protein involved in Fe transport
MNKPLHRVTVGAAVAAILGTAAIHSPIALSGEQSADDSLAEVTVTGSRIVRRDLTAPSPIVTVGNDLFEQTSTSAVETALNQLPQFVPSQTMFSAADVQPSAFNNPGIVTLNLRGLGANRNLVLIDGRRAQPANALLVVDINSIPAAAIESVEIISGGASATYGADAMGGVTNFKMKRDFQGLSLNVQGSMTEEGGGEEYGVSALLGGNFGEGRGNAMVGLSYTKREALMASEREFYVDGWRNVNTPGGEGIPFSNLEFPGNAPSQAAWESIFGTGRNYTNEEVYVNPDGTLFLNSAANRVGYTGPVNDQFKILGSGTSNPGTVSANNLNTMITTPMERYSVFANAHYDISDNASVFLQANLSSMQVDTVLTFAPATSQWNATIPVDGRAIPSQLATLLASRPNPTGSYSLSRVLDFADARRTFNSTDMYQVLAGVEGDLFSTDWRYEAYFSHGETSLVTEMSGFPGLQNYRAIVQAPNFGANYNDRTRNIGPPLFFELKCTTGLPIMTYFDPSQDCINSLSGNMKHLTEMKQDIAEVNVTGDLFDLPAGTIGSAWGASWRQNQYRWAPDDQLIRSSTNYPIGLFPTSRTGGSTNVTELYGELLVPVLSDIPGFRQFNLELGARWSDYNTAGSIWTYKALVDWQVLESVRIRGGYQLANRAPNVAELFTGATTSVVGFPGADPCMSNTTNTTWGNHPGNTTNRNQVIQLCSDIINRSRGDVNQSPWHTGANFPNNIVGPFPFNFPFELANITGNPDLRNEEAETWTAGVVLTSPFDGLFSNATLAIDWYQVHITDAIAPTNAFSVYEKCLNRDGSNPSYDVNNTYCRLITRDRDGYRATVDTPYFNLGGIETSGIDVQFNWSFAAGPGRVNVNSVINFLDYYRDQVSPADAFIDSTGTFRSGGQYDYKTFTTVNYMQDAWSVGIRHRFLPSIDSADSATNPNTTVQGAGSYNMIDLFASYAINDMVRLTGGIDNLFDFDPEIVGRNPGVTEAAGSTVPTYYDVLGRRYFLSVQLDF